MKQLYSYLLTMLAVIFVSLNTGVLSQLLNYDTLYFLLIRSVLSLAVVFFLLKIKDKSFSINIKERKHDIISGVFLALRWFFFYSAIRFSNAPTALLAVSLGPMITSLLEPIIMMHTIKVDKKELLIALLPVLGLMGIYHMNVDLRFGLLLGLVSAIFNVLSLLYNKKTIELQKDNNLKSSPFYIMFYQLIGATIVVLLAFVVSINRVATTSVLPSKYNNVIIVLIIAFTLLSSYLTFRALKYITTYSSTLIYSLQPFLGILSVFVFLNDIQLQTSFYIGAMLIFVSLILHCLNDYYNSHPRVEKYQGGYGLALQPVVKNDKTAF
ncbi:MAG: DMT family transporter [Phycisphaerales bacterium]|nr:DMT family transporter [Phycisphaerales bacterium]